MHGAHWQTDVTLAKLSQQLNNPPPNQFDNSSPAPSRPPPALLDQLANLLPDLIRQLGGQAWAPHHQDLTPQSLHRAHQLGLITNTWTVNKPNEINRLTKTSIDGIITDYPKSARKTPQPPSFC